MAKLQSSPAEIRERLRRVVQARFGGTQAEFYAQCGFARNTAQGWFRTSPRMPDTTSLAIVADKSGVSLDWLVLGRGEMEWPQGALSAAVRAELERRHGKRRAAEVLKHLASGPAELWEEAVAYAVDFVEEKYDSEFEEES